MSTDRTDHGVDSKDVRHTLGKLTQRTDWKAEGFRGLVRTREIDSEAWGILRYFIGYRLRLVPVLDMPEPLFRAADGQIYEQHFDGRRTYYMRAELEKFDSQASARLQYSLLLDLTGRMEPWEEH